MYWLKFIIFIALFISFIIFLYYAQSKFRDLSLKQKELDTWEMDIHFEEYPSSYNVENNKICNASTLEPCKMDNPTDTFGCNELNVQCTHFQNDTEYIETDGERYTIPANATDNDGYLLVVLKAAEACNVNTGDLVLVALSNTSNEYGVMCECKKPGFIGKDEMMGNCTVERTCKVDNINQPIKDMKCVCESPVKINVYTSTDQDAIPYCREMTINEANQTYPDGWSQYIAFKGDVLDTSFAHKNIVGNMRCDKMINPCRFVVGDLVANDRFKKAIAQPYKVNKGDTTNYFCPSIDLTGDGVAFMPLRRMDKKQNISSHSHDMSLPLKYPTPITEPDTDEEDDDDDFNDIEINQIQGGSVFYQYYVNGEKYVSHVFAQLPESVGIRAAIKQAGLDESKWINAYVTMDASRAAPHHDYPPIAQTSYANCTRGNLPGKYDCDLMPTTSISSQQGPHTFARYVGSPGGITNPKVWGLSHTFVSTYAYSLASKDDDGTIETASGNVIDRDVMYIDNADRFHACGYVATQNVDGLMHAILSHVYEQNGDIAASSITGTVDNPYYDN